MVYKCVFQDAREEIDIISGVTLNNSNTVSFSNPPKPSASVSASSSSSRTSLLNRKKKTLVVRRLKSRESHESKNARKHHPLQKKTNDLDIFFV